MRAQLPEAKGANHGLLRDDVYKQRLSYHSLVSPVVVSCLNSRLFEASCGVVAHWFGEVFLCISARLDAKDQVHLDIRGFSLSKSVCRCSISFEVSVPYLVVSQLVPLCLPIHIVFHVCVCVFLYFYPATCGPKGHGSGSAAALEQRQ